MNAQIELLKNDIASADEARRCLAGIPTGGGPAGRTVDGYDWFVVPECRSLNVVTLLRVYKYVNDQGNCRGSAWSILDDLLVPEGEKIAALNGEQASSLVSTYKPMLQALLR